MSFTATAADRYLQRIDLVDPDLDLDRRRYLIQEWIKLMTIDELEYPHTWYRAINAQIYLEEIARARVERVECEIPL